MIVLVEDDAITLATTAEILKGRGFDVLGAGTYIEAVELILKHHPDVLIIDRILPCSRSGLELLLLKPIRNKWASIVVVITSALASGTIEDTLPPLTFQLQKPFKVDDLIRILERFGRKNGGKTKTVTA